MMQHITLVLGLLFVSNSWGGKPIVLKNVTKLTMAYPHFCIVQDSKIKCAKGGLNEFAFPSRLEFKEFDDIDVIDPDDIQLVENYSKEKGITRYGAALKLGKISFWGKDFPTLSDEDKTNVSQMFATHDGDFYTVKEKTAYCWGKCKTHKVIKLSGEVKRIAKRRDGHLCLLYQQHFSLQCFDPFGDSIDLPAKLKDQKIEDIYAQVYGGFGVLFDDTLGSWDLEYDVFEEVRLIAHPLRIDRVYFDTYYVGCGCYTDKEGLSCFATNNSPGPWRLPKSIRPSVKNATEIFAHGMYGCVLHNPQTLTCWDSHSYFLDD